MQTILDILKRPEDPAHGLYLKIDNPPYMELVIEATESQGRGITCHLCGALR